MKSKKFRTLAEVDAFIAKYNPSDWDINMTPKNGYYTLKYKL